MLGLLRPRSAGTTRRPKAVKVGEEPYGGCPPVGGVACSPCWFTNRREFYPANGLNMAVVSRRRANCGGHVSSTPAGVALVRRRHVSKEAEDEMTRDTREVA